MAIKEIINIIKTGYAVHISRPSHSGRYLYTIGRDAKIDLIDLYMDPPQRVAEIKIGLEARSWKPLSKGFEDNWRLLALLPPQYVFMDGPTLEPKNHVNTRHDGGYAEYHPEPRVAAQLWRRMNTRSSLSTLRETGKVLG